MKNMNNDKFWDLYIKEVTQAAHEEQATMDYNDRMRNESDKHSEYMEMKSMYEDGLLES